MKAFYVKRVLCVVTFLALCTTMVNAEIYEHVCISGFYYDIDDDAKTATVTYESLNPEENYASLAENSYYIDTYATIRWQGNDIPVVGIGQYAFAGCPILEVRLNENIKSIGNYAFSNCKKLRDVMKCESLETIGEHAFSGCNKLEHLYLPEGLTKIGADAFYGCTGVAHISLPSTLNSIGARAFGGCSALKEITSYVDGIVVLNEASKVFDGLADPAAVTLRVPVSAKSLYKNAAVWPKFNIISFIKDANGIMYIIDQTEMTAVVTYEKYAGDNYTNLSSTISIPAYIRYIGKNYIVTEIGDHAFIHNTIVEVKMPNVKRIGNLAFGYTKMRNIVIPEGVTALGDSAIFNCSELQNIYIPTTLINYGRYAIDKNISLKKVYNMNPEVVDLSGNDMFTDLWLPSDATLYVPASSVEAYKQAAVWRNFWHIEPFSDYLTGKCGDNIYWTFVQETGELRLSGYGEIPDYEKLNPSPWYEFRDKITKVDIPETVSRIGAYAFADCSAMTSHPITESITSIGANAFKGCSAMEEVLVPKGVTSLEEGTFEGCDAVTSVVWNATNCNRYYFGPQVSSFTFGDGVKVIHDSICSGMNIRSVVIPDGVTSIGEKAFAHCPSLGMVSMPSSVKTVGRYAFYDCPKLWTSFTDHVQNAGPYYVASVDDKRYTQYTLWKDTRWIGEEAFKDCSKMTDFTCTDNVERIGELAFSGCSALKTLTISSSVKTIDKEAFKDCGALDSIRVNAETPPTLGENVFSGITCSGVRLYVPRKSYNDYKTAEQWKDFWIPTYDQIAGKCGNNLTWMLDTITYDMVIRGTGEMWDYNDGDPSWIKWAHKIKSIVIESGVTSIGAYVFYNMRQLNGVQIPYTVKEIGDYAFMSSTAIAFVTCLASTPPTLGTEVFKNVDCSKIPLSVPSGSVDRYKAAEQWKNFKIQSTALNGSCGASVTWSFYVASGKLIISGTGEMDNYPSDYPEWYPYRSLIKSIEIQNGVTSIGTYAFYNLDQVKTVEIAPSVVTIGDGAFARCSALASMTCLVATPPAISFSVFTGVDLSSMSLFVPKNRISAYKAAYVWKNFYQIKAADASGKCGDNMTWYYSAQTDELQINGTGSMWNILYEDPTWYPYKDIIQKVKIGKDIAGITDGVFADHSALTAINVADGNWNYISVDGVLCNKAKTTIVAYPKAKSDASYTISAEIKTIKSYAFSGCTNITQLNSLAVTPPTLGSNVFQGMDCEHILLFVPAGTGSAYRAVEGWNKFNIKDESQDTRSGTMGTKGIWDFADGVLTIDYEGTMPDCTKDETDHQVAYRLQWIDFLADIKEVVIKGVDVEIQPFFLYFEGDGPSGSHPDDHIKKVTLSSGVKSIGRQAFALYDLKQFCCYGIEPPTLSSYTNSSTGYRCFWRSRIEANKAFLILQSGASSGYYMADREWMFFANLGGGILTNLRAEDDPVGINSPTTTSSNSKTGVKVVRNGRIYILRGDKVFTVDGREVSGERLNR